MKDFEIRKELDKLAEQERKKIKKEKKKLVHQETETIVKKD